MLTYHALSTLRDGHAATEDATKPTSSRRRWIIWVRFTLKTNGSGDQQLPIHTGEATDLPYFRKILCQRMRG